MATFQPTGNPIHDAVHNVTVTQSARLNLQGRALPTQQVQYYVGEHGPFTDSYDLESYTPEEAEQGILARVHSIQQLGAQIPGLPVVAHRPELPPAGGEPIMEPPRTIYTPIKPGEPLPPHVIRAPISPYRRL